MTQGPRWGTPSGDRALRSMQAAYDNMTPEDVYGPDEPDGDEGDETEGKA